PAAPTHQQPRQGDQDAVPVSAFLPPPFFPARLPERGIQESYGGGQEGADEDDRDRLRAGPGRARLMRNRNHSSLLPVSGKPRTDVLRRAKPQPITSASPVRLFR